MEFIGTPGHAATEELRLTVNAAITLGRPAALEGGPGTGGTGLARRMAAAPALPLVEWRLGSPARAARRLHQDGAASRLRGPSEHLQGHARRLPLALRFALHPLSPRGLRKTSI